MSTIFPSPQEQNALDGGMRICHFYCHFFLNAPGTKCKIDGGMRIRKCQYVKYGGNQICQFVNPRIGPLKSY